MRPIVVLACVLFTLLAFGIAAARLRGTALPERPAAVFTTAEGMTCQDACLFGVRPGAMSYRDALALVRSHPATRGMFRSSNEGSIIGLADEFRGANFDVSLAGHNGLLEWIALSDVNMRDPLASPGTLGEVVRRYGPPDVVYTENGAVVYFFFERAGMMVSVLTHGRYATLQFNSRIFAIILHRDLSAGMIPEIKLHLRRWRGFVAVRNYLPLTMKYFTP